MIYLQGMLGLGDNIYQRAVVRELTQRDDVMLETPWPELYADLPIRCTMSHTELRTQRKNVARSRYPWATPLRDLRPRRIHYMGGEGGSMLQGLCASANVVAHELTFDLPPFAQAPRAPYVVVRPATLRVEWPAECRNPLPEYLELACALAREHGFRVVSVADLKVGREQAVLPLPPADETYHAGELALEPLLALIRGAAAVVGGVGWLLPAAIAYRVPMLLIYGGWGQDNGPARLLDRRMDVSRVEQVLPTRFCMCRGRGHRCDKRIDDFAARAERWTRTLAAMVA